MFRLGLESFLQCFFHTHLRCSLICTGSHSPRWVDRSTPYKVQSMAVKTPSHYQHPPVLLWNFPLIRKTSSSSYSCCHNEFFCKFHYFLRPLAKENRVTASFLFFFKKVHSVNRAAILNVSQCCRYSKENDNHEGRFILYVSALQPYHKFIKIIRLINNTFKS